MADKIIKKIPTVRDAVEKYLKDNGYTGLFSDECGCEIDDLMPCDAEVIPDCQCGYKVICTKECEGEFGHDEAEAGKTWHIQALKEDK